MLNPYPGPRPYSHEEDHIFAGRDQDTSELASLIVSHQVTLLYAQSGAGKTSLVNAGLTAPLREKGVQVLPNARVGIPVPEGLPLDDVANVFTFSAIGGLFPEMPNREGWSLRATLSDAFARVPVENDEFGDPRLRLFVLDQLEELFTAYPQRWQDRKDFFQQLAELLRSNSELRVVLVLREDYLAAFNDFALILPEGARARYHLEGLRESEAVSAVEKPLEGTLVKFDIGVSIAIVRDLMAITVIDPMGQSGTAPGEFVEPVQLQVVCFSLFEQLPDSSDLITMEAYRQFGDPDKALETFYSNAVASVAKATGVSQGEVRDWCESRLITPAGTRGLVFHGRGSTAGISNDVVTFLEERHLIRPEMRSGSRWYELTHDRFVRPIQRSNLAWKSERWSKSFEVEFAAAIKEATNGTGTTEEQVRSYLDSLISRPGERLSVGTPTVPEGALGVLVGAGLLLREDDGDSQRFTLVNTSVSEAIQLANQSWRGENWAEAKTMRELQARAEEWRRRSKVADLLPRRSELRHAHSVLELARVSGVRLTDAVEAFVDAGLRREMKEKLAWGQSAALFFAVATLAVLLFPSRIPLRWQVLSFLNTGFGAALTAVSMNDENDRMVFFDLPGFIGVLIVTAAFGLCFSSVYRWSVWLGIPLGIVVGFFTFAFGMGIIYAARGIKMNDSGSVKRRLGVRKD